MSNTTIWTGYINFPATGTAPTVIQVPAPHRGILRGYHLVLDDGSALPNFSAKLYTSNPASPAGGNPKSLYEILSFNQSAAADDNTDISFLNKDGTPSLPQRLLYLEITPADTTPRTYVFSVTVRSF